jgi:hypothetical protein
MQDVADMLDRFAANGWTNGELIERSLAELARERDEARALKGRAGDDSSVTAADVNNYRRMLATGLAAPLLALAAEYAAGAKDPLAFAARVAENWQKAGIRTEEAARAEHDARGEPSGRDNPRAHKDAPRGRKENPALGFSQRQYTQEEWNSLAMDLDALEEDG